MDAFDVVTFADLSLQAKALGEGKRRYRFAAEPQARQQAVDQLGVLTVSSLSAAFEIKRDSLATGFYVSGEVQASVEQACVVTLAPVQQDIVAQLKRHFVPVERFEGGAHADADGPDIVVDAEATDDLEPLEGDLLDIPTAILEVVALELDPYPRAPGVTFDMDDSSDEASTESPFAVLAQLRGQKTTP